MNNIKCRDSKRSHLSCLLTRKHSQIFSRGRSKQWHKHWRISIALPVTMHHTLWQCLNCSAHTRLKNCKSCTQGLCGNELTYPTVISPTRQHRIVFADPTITIAQRQKSLSLIRRHWPNDKIYHNSQPPTSSSSPEPVLIYLINSTEIRVTQFPLTKFLNLILPCVT